MDDKLSLKSIQCNGCGTFYTAPSVVNSISDEFTTHARIIDTSLQIDGQTPLTIQQIAAKIAEYKAKADALSNHNVFKIIYAKLGNNLIINIKRDLLEGIIHYDTGDVLTAKEAWLNCPTCNLEGHRVKL